MRRRRSGRFPRPRKQRRGSPEPPARRSPAASRTAESGSPACSSLNILHGMLARPRGFVPVVAAIALGGAVLRALYLFTVARHTVGIGDWFFYHWQAGLIANGRGFLDPFQLLQ